MNTQRFYYAALFCALLMIVPAILPAQAIQWEYEYGREDIDDAYTVVEASDGGYVAAGLSYAHGWMQGYLVKVGGDGMLQWDRYIDSAVVIRSIHPWKKGGWIIAGDITSGGNNALYVAAVDANGGLLWRDTVTGSMLRAILTHDGGLLVVGERWDMNTGIRVFLCKYDGSGTRLWMRTLDWLSSTHVNDIIQTSDHNYVVAGSGIFSAEDYGDMFVAGVNENGERLLLHSVDISSYDDARTLLPASDGGYLLGGSFSNSASDGGVCLVKLDANGRKQWVLQYADDSSAQAFQYRDMVRLPDDGYAVLAMRHQRNPYLLRLDAEGGWISDTTYMRADSVCDLRDIILTTDGGLVLAGFSGVRMGKQNVLMMKIDINGVSGVKDPEEVIERLWLK